MISKILKVFPFKQNKYLNNCIIFLYNLIKINLSPAKKRNIKFRQNLILFVEYYAT